MVENKCNEIVIQIEGYICRADNEENHGNSQPNPTDWLPRSIEWAEEGAQTYPKGYSMDAIDDALHEEGDELCFCYGEIGHGENCSEVDTLGDEMKSHSGGNANYVLYVDADHGKEAM